MEDHLQHAAARMEAELRRAVKYIDDEVVPEVRRNSSAALRMAAEQLHRLAEQVDDERVKAERVKAERVDAERVNAEHMSAERVKTERVKTEGGGI